MKYSVFNNRTGLNFCKKNNIKIEEIKEKVHAYGSHYFYKIVDKIVDIDTKTISKKNLTEEQIKLLRKSKN